jgi:hypothetical protein
MALALLLAAPVPPVAAGPLPLAVRPIDAPEAPSRTSHLLTATYTVRLALRYDARTMTADETIRVRNSSGGGIERLELNTVAPRLGQMRLHSVQVDGRRVVARVDDMTLHVPLGRTLAPSAEVTVRLRFDATLRTGTSGSDWMFTRANGVLELYRWLPWISRARPFDRPSFGIPFLLPVSPRVALTVTTDRPVTLVTGARRVATNGLTQTFVAERVRDLAIVASPMFATSIGSIGTTRIRVSGRTGFPRARILEEARRALARLEARLGPYPYPELHVAQGAADWIAVAAPGVVWVQHDLAAARIDDVLTHELAHQWFFVQVGSDPALEPWAHEGTSEFMERSILGSFTSSRCPTSRLDLTIHEYSASCFHPVVYVQGANFLEQVRRRMGSEAFWRAMRAYVARHRFGFGGTARLLATLDAHTPVDLRPLFAPRFPRHV